MILALANKGLETHRCLLEDRGTLRTMSTSPMTVLGFLLQLMMGSLLQDMVQLHCRSPQAMLV